MVVPIPVADGPRGRGFPVAVLLLVLGELALFGLARYGARGPEVAARLVLAPGSFRRAWAGPDPAWERGPAALFEEALLPAVGHQLLHVHELQLLGNLFFLWIFGRALERRAGSLPFLALFLGGGLAALGGHLYLHPDDPGRLAGSTGAVAAVLGAYLALWPRGRVRAWLFLLFVIPVEAPALVFLPLWLLLQGVNDLPTLLGLAGARGVAFPAHLAALAAGALAAGLLPVRRAAGPGGRR